MRAIEVLAKHNPKGAADVEPTLANMMGDKDAQLFMSLTLLDMAESLTIRDWLQVGIVLENFK